MLTQLSTSWSWSWSWSWAWQKEDDSLQCFSTMFLVVGVSLVQYSEEKLISFSLVGFNASQWERIWGISSVRSEQAVDKRQNLDYLVDQCLLSSWVLYLLDNILHWTVVIDMFAGDEPVVDHIGCSLDNDINAGLKYVSDESSDTSLRSLIS